jgi:metal-responsive CopG/Arc/MetJ family transcriptional regulator
VQLTNNKKRRSVQMALRMPVDLAEAMDALCRTGDLRRSELIVAALRKHLNKPDPAQLSAEKAA